MSTMTTLRGSSNSLKKIAVRTWISGANEIGARPVGDSANQALQAFELLVFETLLTRPPFEFVRHPQKYR
jgi:hypothetical protein